MDRFAKVPVAVALDRRLADRPLALRILILLYGHADREGICFPKQTELADRLGSTKIAVSRCIDILIGFGHIEKVERRKYGYVYRVACPRVALESNSEEAARVAPQVNSETVPRVALQGNSQNEPRVASQVNQELPCRLTRELPPRATSIIEEQTKVTNQGTDQHISVEILPPDHGFSRWWKAYPKSVRKVGPKQSAAKYARIIRDGLATEEQLFAAVNAYASATDPRFICKPMTWLNEQRWEVDYSQAQHPASPTRPNGHSLADTFAEARAIRQRGF